MTPLVSHISLGTNDYPKAKAFHAKALACGGTGDGAPGIRKEYSDGYYAAFMRDLDGNEVEAVVMVKG